jgi:predicted DNA-binding ribbon-helix-helix protein
LDCNLVFLFISAFCLLFPKDSVDWFTYIVVLGATTLAKSAKGKLRMPKPTGRRKTPVKDAPIRDVRAKGVEPLQGRNILLHGQRRTSMRLEPSMWTALEEIAAREGMPLSDLCSRIDDRLTEQAQQRGAHPKGSEVTLSSGVRVFLFSYYRAAATEQGHLQAGHGLGDPFVGTPFEKKNPQDDGDSAETAEEATKDDSHSQLSPGGGGQTKAGDAAAA